MTHFSGVSGREAIATIDCMGTLFQQFETAFEFIVSRLSRSFVIEKKKRKEELEIPAVAIRELLINAIVQLTQQGVLQKVGRGKGSYYKGSGT